MLLFTPVESKKGKEELFLDCPWGRMVEVGCCFQPGHKVAVTNVFLRTGIFYLDGHLFQKSCQKNCVIPRKGRQRSV